MYVMMKSDFCNNYSVIWYSRLLLIIAFLLNLSGILTQLFLFTKHLKNYLYAGINHWYFSAVIRSEEEGPETSLQILNFCASGLCPSFSKLDILSKRWFDKHHHPALPPIWQNIHNISKVGMIIFYFLDYKINTQGIHILLK